MKKKVLLWLDDCRNPFAYGSTWIQDYSPVSNPDIIVWLTSFDQFTNWIKGNGLPAAICFDHDLGDIKQSMSHQEKTGYDCAKWLVDYCMDNNYALPLWNIQSNNPAGYDNIAGLLNNFEKMYNN